MAAILIMASESHAQARPLQCSAGGQEDVMFSQVFDIDFDKWVVRRRKTGFPAYGPTPAPGTTMEWQDPTGGPGMALDTGSLKLTSGSTVWTCKPITTGN
ncbi:MAG: hypothetical protein ACKOEC_17825 [Acidimicrobiia bacterium]